MKENNRSKTEQSQKSNGKVPIIILAALVMIVLAIALAVVISSGISQKPTSPMNVEFDAKTGDVTRLSVAPFLAFEDPPAKLESPDDITFEILTKKVPSGYYVSEALEYDEAQEEFSQTLLVLSKNENGSGGSAVDYPLIVTKDAEGKLTDMYANPDIKDTLLAYIYDGDFSGLNMTGDYITWYAPIDLPGEKDPATYAQKMDKAEAAMEGKTNRFGEDDLLVNPMTFAKSVDALVENNSILKDLMGWQDRNFFESRSIYQTVLQKNEIDIDRKQTLFYKMLPTENSGSMVENYERQYTFLASGKSKATEEYFELRHTETYSVSSDSEDNLRNFINHIAELYALNDLTYNNDDQTAWRYTTSGYNPFNTPKATLSTAQVRLSPEPEEKLGVERYKADIEITYSVYLEQPMTN